MALTSTQVTNITKLAVAMFGVAPGGYMSTLTTIFESVNGDMNAFANALAATPAFTSASYYPNYLTNAQVATKMVNSYGLTGDAATAANAYFLANLNAGVSVGTLFATANDFLAANSSDANYATAAATLANKAAVAEYYTVTLAGTSTDLGILGGAVSGVTATTDVSTDAAKAAVIANSSAATTGQTFTLTKGLDNVAGTAGNDTILGSVDTTAGSDLNTSSPIDVVNGGAGTDTFKISAVTALGTANLPSLSNVEIIEASGAAGVTLNTAAIDGVTNLNVIKAGGAVAATAAATTDVSVAMKAAGAAVGVDGGKDVTVNITDVAANTNAITVGAASASAGSVTVSSTGKTAATGTDIVMGNIAVTGGTTINVTQKATSDASKVIVGAATTHTQGNVTVTGNAATTTVTVKQDAAVAANGGAATVAGVTETASVKFTAMTAGQTLTAAGLTFTAAKNLTKEEVAQAFSNLIKGVVPVAGDTQGSGSANNGVYTGVLTGWTSGAASGDTVVFTSTAAGVVADLAFTGTASATVTTTQGVAASGTAAKLGVAAGTVSVTDANATIKTITIDGYANGSSTTTTSVLETLNLSNAAAGAVITVADSAATLALNLEKIGTNLGDAAIAITAAPTTLNVKSTGNNYVDLSANTTETLNVTGTGVLKADATALGGLKSVKVSETAGLTLGDVTATLTSVDTTATTGTVTLNIDGQKATYTGGAGVDNVTLTTAAPTKVINTGAGNDKVTLANGTTAMGANGAINGGEGEDTLSMLTANAVTASGATTFATKVAGFEHIELTGATGAQEVELDVLGNYNKVTVLSAANGATLNLDGLTSGATITLENAANNTNLATVTAMVTDAELVANTTDVLNININAKGENGTADENGTVVAAGVETVNINVVDKTAVQTPTDTKADTQNLTLKATSASKVVVTGNTALNLTNTGNVKVAEIDGSAMTAALSVQAAGNVATVVKGGSGNDVLTASATGTGNVAQISTLTFTDGSAAAAMAIGDSISVTIGANTVTQAFTNDFATTLGALNTQINGLAAVNSTIAGTVITITAATAGTPFTVNTVFTPNDANITGAFAAVAATTTDVDTITFTDNAGTGGNMDAGDSLSFTITEANGTVRTITQAFATDFASTVAAMTAQVDALANFSASDDGSVITITGTEAAGAFTVSNATFTDAGTASAVTGAAAEGATNFLDTATLTLTETVTMGADDTITVTVTDAGGVQTSASVTFNTDFDTTMDAVVTAIEALTGIDATTTAYVAGTNVLTVGSTRGEITNLTVSVTDAAMNSVSSAFATTTENLSVAAVADKLFGGNGDDTLVNNAGLTEMTGGAGNDLFKISTAALNVNSYNTILDFQAGDLIEMTGATLFKSAKVELGSTAVFQDYANAAINALGANEAGWFQVDGNTYVVMDKFGGGATDTATFTNGEDLIVKLSGLVDLSNASFNGTYDTIGLI